MAPEFFIVVVERRAIIMPGLLLHSNWFKEAEK